MEIMRLKHIIILQNKIDLIQESLAINQHEADLPKNDKFQYTYFVHKINSFDMAPKKLLASDSCLRPDRSALEMGDLSKDGAEKSNFNAS